VRSSAAFRHFPRAALLRVASDERLVELVRGGSEAAFEAIYDRHHRGILAFCRHMLASADEGEDALQHTFMAAYRHLVDGSAEIQLRPWLYAIARNRCLTMLRARRERPLADHEAPATEHLST
jgi:RNA polymerase sigma factor (sigma-70 family)